MLMLNFNTEQWSVHKVQYSSISEVLMRLSAPPYLGGADVGHRWGFDYLIKNVPTPWSYFNDQIPSFSGVQDGIFNIILLYCIECQIMHDIRYYSSD